MISMVADKLGILKSSPPEVAELVCITEIAQVTCAKDLCAIIANDELPKK